MEKEFDEIYQLYAADVYRFILKLSRNEAVALDILQDTMLKAIMSINTFKGNCSMKTYLCTIARNEYYNYVKKSENKNISLDESIDNCLHNSIENQILDKSQAIEIHRILHRLDEPYKEIFTLRVFAELKFLDIGSIFGKSENWARVSFFRAKEKIIKLLQKEEV